MLTRRSILAFLVAVNVILAAALISISVSPPTAFAEIRGRAGDFIAVTAKPSVQNFDVVYLLDLPARKLHAFYPADVQTKTLRYANYRDLAKDFE